MSHRKPDTADSGRDRTDGPESAPAGPVSHSRARDSSRGTQTPPALPESETPREFGGRQGPDPTRYGDWEMNGRCIDF